jgi:pimeloyl-ACP methyl ester carboxylesterase
MLTATRTIPFTKPFSARNNSRNINQTYLKPIMSNSIKTIVLVHGAFADGSSWAKVIPLLTAKGFKTIAVQNPLSSLADEVAAAHRVIDMQEGQVLLVGHSWGGVVITEAGNHAKVLGLVYVAASAPDAGKSFQDWDYPPPAGIACIAPYGNDGYLALTHTGIVKHFVPDLPAAEAEVVWATQGPVAGRCFGETISQPAWRSKRSWYVVAEHDEMVPPAAERDFAARMKATTLTLSSGHVPMLSQPEAVADFIARAAASFSE